MSPVDTTAKIITADPVAAAKYRADGWWSDERHADRVRKLAAERPNDPAYITETARFTWADYDTASERIAAALLELGLERGDRVAVVLPGGPAVHAALVGVEKAGLVAVGIGARAGDREISHLLTRTAAKALITHAVQRGRPASDLKAAVVAQSAALEHLVLVPDFLVADQPILVDGVASTATGPVPLDLGIGPDELFLLNSTSGTTGLPKCVMHTPNRWYYFHKLAEAAGRFRSDEVFLGAVPAPFGFGMWTAHFSPAILGCPTLVT